VFARFRFNRPQQSPMRYKQPTNLVFSTCGPLYNHVTAARTLVKRVVR
jgi:hypothetical protein